MSPLYTILILLFVSFVQAQQGYGELRSSIVTGRGFATPPKHSHSHLGDKHSHSLRGGNTNNKRQSPFPGLRETPEDWGVISNPYKNLDLKNNNKNKEGVEDWEELNLEEIQSYQRGKGRVNGWQELGSISHPVVQDAERLFEEGYRETSPEVELYRLSLPQGGRNTFTPNTHWFGQSAGDTAQIYNNVVKYTQKYKKDPIVFGRFSTNEQRVSSSEMFSPTNDWFGEKERGLQQVPSNVPRHKRGHDILLTNIAQEDNSHTFSPSNDWLAVRKNRINGKRQLSFADQQNEPEIITMDNVHKYIGDNNNNNLHTVNKPGNSFIVSVAAGYSARGPNRQSIS